MAGVETKRNWDGRPLVRGKCALCDKCWLYADVPGRLCIYGGPYSGTRRLDAEGRYVIGFLGVPEPDAQE